MIKFRWPITRWSTVRKELEMRDAAYMDLYTAKEITERQLNSIIQRLRQQVANLKQSENILNDLLRRRQQIKEDAYFEQQ